MVGRVDRGARRWSRFKAGVLSVIRVRAHLAGAWRRLLAILLAIVCQARPATAQARLVADWRWVHFGPAEGLPSPIVNVVVRASDGTMYAATERGPAWFDGYRWQPITTRDGTALTGERTTMLSAGQSGAILIRHGAGLYRVARRGGVAELLLTRTRGSDGYFGAAECGGLVWTIDQAGERLRLRFLQDRAWHEHPLPVQQPRPGFESHLYGSNSGQLVFASGGRMWRLRGADWELFANISSAPGRVSSLLEMRSGTWRAVLASSDLNQGLYWRSADGGDPTWTRFLDFGNEAPVAFAAGDDGASTAMLAAGDILHSDSNDWRRLQVPRGLATTTSLAYDATGAVWFATRNGLWLWLRRSERWTQWRVGPSAAVNRVNAIAIADDGRVAVATAGGVAVLGADGALRPDPGLPPVVFTSLAWNSAGRLVAGSGAGLVGVYEQSARGWIHRTDAPGLDVNGIHKMVRGRDGTIWMLGLGVASGTRGGVWRMRGNRLERVMLPESELGARYYDFVEDTTGAHWFVSNRGLLRERGGRFELVANDRFAPPDLLFSATTDGGDGVWVGTRSTGVAHVTASLKIEREPAQTTSPQGEVRALSRGADGKLWAVNYDGLWVRAGETWSLLTETFGLPTPSLWPVATRGEDVYIGTFGVGVLRLRLDELRDAVPHVEPSPPSMTADGLQLNWTVATPNGLVSPSDIDSRWRVDAQPWSDWGHVTSVLAPVWLPWRRHVLRVEARTPLGVQSTQAAQLEFVVPTPIWLQREVLAALTLLLSAFAWVSVLLWRRRVQNRRLALRIREAERMELVGSFAAGMAHEFNNLLTTIIINSELIGDATPRGAEPSPAVEIRRAALAAAGQVRSLLSFTRDQALVLERVDLREALATMRSEIEALLGSAVQATWSLGPVPVPVRLEANGFTAIMRALAENARDAMPGGGHFTVALRIVELSANECRHLNLATAERWAELDIGDTGHGMAFHETRRVFEPYYSTHRDRPGLGLSLVYGLTRRFGGAVQLHSSTGQGTEFRIHLPIVTADS